MKNGQKLTAWLNECAENLRLIQSDNLEELDRLHERICDESDLKMWHALLDDGWTVAELDDAYERRFAFRVDRSL